MNHQHQEIRPEEVSQTQKPDSLPAEKLPYEEPQLVVHGKIEKLTLQTG